MARISKEKQSEIKTKIKAIAKQKFDEVGFEKTSTKQIAKEVGIAEGTLFNYFDSKTELFFEVFGDSYYEYLEETKHNVTLGDNISEILFSHFEKIFGNIQEADKYKECAENLKENIFLYFFNVFISGVVNIKKVFISFMLLGI